MNDVPGAAFMYSDVEKHSAPQLPRWLECRGMKRSGTKSLLLERYACDLYAYSLFVLNYRPVLMMLIRLIFVTAPCEFVDFN